MDYEGYGRWDIGTKILIWSIVIGLIVIALGRQSNIEYLTLPIGIAIIPIGVCVAYKILTGKNKPKNK